jgi:hypothetical protein
LLEPSPQQRGAAALPELPPNVIAEAADSIPDLAEADSDRRLLALYALRERALYGVDPAGYPAGAPKIVYIVDRSGSMNCIYDFLNSELANAINKLNSAHMVNVIWFSDGDPIRFQRKMVPAGEDNKTRLMRTSAEIQPCKATRPHMALEWALDFQPDLVVLLSDGEFEPGVVDELTRFSIPNAASRFASTPSASRPASPKRWRISPN